MRRPTVKELEGLSIDELSELREKIREMLLVNIAEEKRVLQDRLKLLMTSRLLTEFGAECDDDWIASAWTVCDALFRPFGPITLPRSRVRVVHPAHAN